MNDCLIKKIVIRMIALLFPLIIQYSILDAFASISVVALSSSNYPHISSPNKISSIGILTSGGDCPSLNACIRAIYKTAQAQNIQVVGLPIGFPGLIQNPPITLNFDESFASTDMLTKGGSRLGGSVGSDYKMIDSLSLDEKALRISQALEDLNIDGIIATGGDTSMNLIAQMLQGSQKGNDIPFVGIPKSIDNDIPQTIYSLGFQSAVSVAAKAISSVRDTAESHRRIMVVECMGRDAGFLTLHSGLAGGADAILLPEFPMDNDSLLKHVQNVYSKNKCAVVAVSEAIRLPQSGETSTYITADGKTRLGGSAEAVARFLSESLALDARHVVLGHTQRGGSPIAFDQVMATTLGVHAVNAMCNGQSKVMVTWTGKAVECIPLDQLGTLSSKCVTVDYPELIAARCMGIYCGTLPQHNLMI
jgi:6-phosphofructokinase 1